MKIALANVEKQQRQEAKFTLARRNNGNTTQNAQFYPRIQKQIKKRTTATATAAAAKKNATEKQYRTKQRRKKKKPHQETNKNGVVKRAECSTTVLLLEYNQSKRKGNIYSTRSGFTMCTFLYIGMFVDECAF